jgi:hypothetical protein
MTIMGWFKIIEPSAHSLSFLALRNTLDQILAGNHCREKYEKAD